MPTVIALKALKRTINDRHVRPRDGAGFIAVGTTLIPLGLLWYAVAPSVGVSLWLTAGIVGLMCLFLVRSFVLMHECGHGSLFRSGALNQVFGFVFGVVSGMPQYVWSRHHLHHHSTNGNWARYGGPLNIVPMEDYAAMSASQQRRYRHSRSIWLAPLAGFVYLILNPRLNWLRGTLRFLGHIVHGLCTRPGVPIHVLARDFTSPYWATSREYWHMFWNNIALLGLWAAMAWMIGPVLFFVCYLASASLAGGAGILLFTVQHNFEHSYASGDDGWDFDQAAMEGTSFLVLPRWLNWFTANIGYHHIHHLSARIPFYCLVACHAEYQHLFTAVTRVRLAQVPAALKCVLWDVHARRIVSVAEYQLQAKSKVAA